MPSVALPEGFRWTWAGDTVRIDLPPVVHTTSHTFEPVLSRADAERLAEAVGAYERKRRAEGTRPMLARVLLAHNPQYALETLAAFKVKLSLALVELGHKAAIDEMVTTSGSDLDLEPEPEAGPGSGAGK